MASTDYAQAFGLHNRWAPPLFAVFYFFVFLYNLFRSIRNHGSANIYRGLAFFSLVRIAAYALRTSMVFSSRAAHTRSIGIAYAVLYNVGFFSLLLSAYNLIHNRDRLAKLHERASKFTSFLHKGRVVHTLLTIATILGTVGAVLAIRGPKMSTGTGLYRAMEYMFLGVALIITALTFMLILVERRVTRSGNAAPPTGNKGHWLLMLTIAGLILARMLYFAVTAHRRDIGAQTNEHYWWPLAAATELLATLLLLVPGLIPIAAHYLAHEHANKGVPIGDGAHNNGVYGNNNNGTYNNGAYDHNGAGMRQANDTNFQPTHNTGFRSNGNAV